MSRVIGQQRAMKILLDSLSNQKRHHAWVFSGPRGVGKCGAAIHFAELILGIDSGSGEAFRDIHIVRKEDVAWAQNPTLIRRKQTNIPIDLLRERIIGGKTSDGKHHDAAAFKTPVVGKEKVFIIDEAELLDEAGQNALLKTLEEPPPRTTIVLVTCREDLLLPTIQSRCQLLSFSPLDAHSMQEWVEQKSFDASQEDISWAVEFSGGSPGLVCEAIDSGLPELATSLCGFLTLNKSMSCTLAATQLVQFVESNVSRWIKLNPNTSKDAANRRAVNLLLLLFGSAIEHSTQNREMLPESILAAGVLVDIEKQLTTNISVKVLLESLCVRWEHLCVGDALFM